MNSALIVALDLLNLIIEVSSQVYNITQHQGTPMILYESRWANIYPPDLAEGTRCGLTLQRYYLKKRLTRRRINGQNLRYQFIASSGYLYDDPADPMPLPGELDHFDSQYGWIYCEMGVIMGLEMKLHARHCGIEQTLVALCVVDGDVNPGPDINLNLENIMPDNSPNVNSGYFRALIVEHCSKLFEIKLPIDDRHYDKARFQRLYGFINPQEVFGWAWTLDLLTYYLEGAYDPAEGNADNVILKESCGTYVSWRNYYIDDFLIYIDNPGFTLRIYQNTVGGSWYLCVPANGDSQNPYPEWHYPEQ